MADADGDQIDRPARVVAAVAGCRFDHRQCRVARSRQVRRRGDRRRSSRAGSAAVFSSRSAVLTASGSRIARSAYGNTDSDVVLQIDRRAAVRALDMRTLALSAASSLPDTGRTKFFSSRNCMNGVSRPCPMAAVIAEMGRALQVLRQREPRIAARAIEQLGQRVARRPRCASNALKTSMMPPGDELRALV